MPIGLRRWSRASISSRSPTPFRSVALYRSARMAPVAAYRTPNRKGSINSGSVTDGLRDGVHLRTPGRVIAGVEDEVEHLADRSVDDDAPLDLR